MTTERQMQQPSSSVASEQYELEDQLPEETDLPFREQRQADLSKKRAFTLIGQSILQLPIWGTQTPFEVDRAVSH